MILVYMIHDIHGAFYHMMHFYCQLSSFVLFSRGVVFTNTVIKEGEETTTMAACLCVVRSRRNPKEKGATMTSCLVCVKGYKGEGRGVLGVRSQRRKVP